jgi:DNA-binding GntR family transcriptional regulator
MKSLGLIQQSSLVQLAADSLRKLIISGEFIAGERLVEERLTERLGISRPPLREALRLLQREGLIVALPRRGVRVAVVTKQDAWEIATLRAALERTAIELAIPVRSDGDLDGCRAHLAEMEMAAERQDRALLIEASFQFHLSIIALAGHRRLVEMYQSLVLQMQLCMALNVRTRELRLGESLEGNVQRHRDLLDRIASGHRDNVLEGLKEHGERIFIDEITDEIEDVQMRAQTT